MILAVIGAALASSLLPASASAATFVGISGDNLVSFSSSRPDIVRSRPLRGLPDSDAIIGVDRRPANGQIYGLGISSRIYTISRTGSVTPVGAGPFTPALFGGSFGFDFNPMADAIRLTSDGEQDARISPATGLVTFSDPPLAYRAAAGAVPADPNFGRAPTVTASAYNNNRAAAPSTELYDIDSGLDVLARQDPPNAGTLNTVGRLGVNATGLVTYDIAPNGTGYAAFKRSGRRFTELFRSTRTAARPGPTAADGRSSGWAAGPSGCRATSASAERSARSRSSASEAGGESRRPAPAGRRGALPPQTSGVETSGESGSDGGYSGSADGRSSIDTKSRSRSPV